LALEKKMASRVERSMVDFNIPLAVKIRKQIVAAISDFNLIQAGDHVMVCCSGGKDSSILLALLKEIQRRAPYNYTLEAVMLDQKQPGFDARAFVEWVWALNVPLTILERDTYSIVKEKVTDGVYCSLCSRLRRAILYDHAADKGFSKMALGHHRDDSNQTLLLNLFYTGKISAMPAKLKSDDGRNILVRPLIYVAEADLQELQKIWDFPIIPCNLCGSQSGMKRQMIKQLLKDLSGKIPEIQNSMLSAQGNVKPSQLLDLKLWNSKDLVAEADAGVSDPFIGL
jgi:tRNA 2-thiocytidine biosynthesis protein TtcA